MRKILPLLLLFTIATYSQKDSITRKNEFKVDVYSIVATGKIGLSYERKFKRKSSFGLTASCYTNNQMKRDFDNDVRNNNQILEVNPYFRYKITNNKSRYLFSEIFTSVNYGEFKANNPIASSNFTSGGSITTTNVLAPVTENYCDIGIGVSAGYTFLIKENFIFEILVGIGKNASVKKSLDYLSRTGINLGYKF